MEILPTPLLINNSPSSLPLSLPKGKLLNSNPATHPPLCRLDLELSHCTYYILFQPMPKSLLTLSAIHKRDRNRRPSLSSSQHKIVSPKIAPTGPNGIPAFVLKRSPPQAIKHTATQTSLPSPITSCSSLPPPSRPTKDDDDDDASSTAGSDMEVDIEALDDDDSLTSYAFRKPRRRPSESTVTPASSYADVTGPPPVPASASKTVSAHELAEVYLSALLSATPGALPIRRINAHLVEMVPSFAALPPPKQRRLVVKALEGRKGELV